MPLSRGAKIGIAVGIVILFLVGIGIGLYFAFRPTYPAPIPLKPLPSQNLVLIPSLVTGQTMTATTTEGSYLQDVTGRYRLALQTDGNLVLYDWTDPTAPLVLWACCSDMNRKEGPWTLSNGTDGNLTLVTSVGRLLWSSGTAGKTSNSALIVTTEGVANLVDIPTGNVVWYQPVYPPLIPISPVPFWNVIAIPSLRTGQTMAENTYLEDNLKRYRLLLQGSDGNLVLYDYQIPTAPKALWSCCQSISRGEGPYRLILNQSGLLQAINSSQPYWSSSQTKISTNAIAFVTPQGVVQVQDFKTGEVIWHAP